MSYFQYFVRRQRRLADPYERGFWHGMAWAFAVTAFVILWVSVGGVS